MYIDYYIGYLSEALNVAGNDTEIFVDRITTVLGETVETADFAAFGRGILTINPKGDGLTSYPEIASFTAVDATNLGFSGVVRGLDKHSVSQTSLQRYYPPGTPLIISITSQTIDDLKVYIDAAVTGSVGTASDTVAGTVKLSQAMGAQARAQSVLVTQQASPNMTLQVKKFAIGDYIYTGGNTSSLVAPVTHPRIDLVAYDKVAAAIVVKQGNEAVSPLVPQMSGDYIPLAYIYNTVGETSIKDVTDGTNGYVYYWCDPVLLEAAGTSKALVTPTVPLGYLAEDGTAYATHLYPELARALSGNYGYGIGVTSTFTAATDIVNATAHGFVNGDPVFFGNVGGGLPGGISAKTLYYVISATTNGFQISLTKGGSAVDITTAGTGTNTSYGQVCVPDVRGSFVMGSGTRQFVLPFDSSNAALVVNASPGTIASVSGSTITTSASHGLTTGDPIYFTGSVPTGMSANTLYFAVVGSSNTLTLANSYYNATVAGSTITLSSTTSGAVLRNSTYFASPTSFSGALVTGLAVALSTTGAAPTGLATATPYFAIKYGTNNRIYLATSNANAYANTPVLVTDVGSGIHTLTVSLSARLPGDTAGEENHHLTIPEMPAHTHTTSSSAQAIGTTAGSGGATGSASITGSTGGDLPHNNLPPYVAMPMMIRY